jgi:two-component system phosphate regulon response regulator PhoB
MSDAPWPAPAISRGRVLVIEDDSSLTDVLEYNLQQAGYEVLVARDGKSGIAAARRETPDVIVLDLMLPEMDGLDVCKQLRADPVLKNVLVLMLTARSEESDQLVGFTAGADDYVTKPFSVKVLLQRIRALLRRREAEERSGDVLSSQGVVIDRVRHRAMAAGKVLDLTPTEFGLLQAMLRQPGRAFSRNELIDSALGHDAIVLERTIDVHIRALRRKLAGHASLIETVRGVGYRFREPGEF